MDEKFTGQSSVPALGKEATSAERRRLAMIQVFITWVLLSATDFFSETMSVIIPPLRDWVNAAKGRFLI
jgi:hypothetical protein